NLLTGIFEATKADADAERRAVEQRKAARAAEREAEEARREAARIAKGEAALRAEQIRLDTLAARREALRAALTEQPAANHDDRTPAAPTPAPAPVVSLPPAAPAPF